MDTVPGQLTIKPAGGFSARSLFLHKKPVNPELKTRMGILQVESLILNTVFSNN